jgi:hypothetical protein
VSFVVQHQTLTMKATNLLREMLNKSAFYGEPA